MGSLVIAPTTESNCRECTKRLGVVRDHLAHVPFVEVGPLKHIQLTQFFLVVRVWSTRGWQTPQESANGFMLSVISVCSFVSHTMGQTRGICRTLEIKMKKTTQVSVLCSFRIWSESNAVQGECGNRR